MNIRTVAFSVVPRIYLNSGLKAKKWQPWYSFVMMAIASQALLVISAILAAPASVFYAEIAAAVAYRKQDSPPTGVRSRAAAIIPAHNEEKGLLSTINNLKEQLRPGDRLIVVADNCNDETAAIAERAGAEVTIRDDQAKIGKGYALDWGLNYLRSDSPDVVIMIDADCRIAPGSIDRLVASAQQHQRPVQALYLMDAPDGSAVSHQVATFAWRVKNWVRPLGLKALGLPCQLMGTGMAFPWGILQSVTVSSGAIVEDLKLGLDLGSVGYAPLFCPTAVVTSTFPQTAVGSTAQRQRWEHGHIGLIVTRFLPLLVQSLRRRDISLLALALDLLVPPLSLLIMILVFIAVMTGIFGYFGGSLFPFAINMGSLALVVLAAAMARVKFARDILPLRTLGLVPLYMLAKLRQYVSALYGRKVSRWVRADRG